MAKRLARGMQQLNESCPSRTSPPSEAAPGSGMAKTAVLAPARTDQKLRQGRFTRRQEINKVLRPEHDTGPQEFGIALRVRPVLHPQESSTIYSLIPQSRRITGTKQGYPQLQGSPCSWPQYTPPGGNACGMPARCCLFRHHHWCQLLRGFSSFHQSPPSTVAAVPPTARSSP